jgi:hypothetical protein
VLKLGAGQLQVAEQAVARCDGIAASYANVVPTGLLLCATSSTLVLAALRTASHAETPFTKIRVRALGSRVPSSARMSACRASARARSPSGRGLFSSW